MKRWLAALMAALAMGVLVGVEARAQATPAATPFGPASLIGGGWKLESMVSADKTVHGSDRQIFYTIRLTTDGTVELTVDCNSGGGTYTLTGDKLTISPLITTMMGCPKGSVGSQFAQMLSGKHTVSWQGDKLILTAPDGAVVTLRPALVDVVWTWNEAKGNATPATAAILPAKYTITSKSDGTLAAGADCNQGKGSFTSSGDQIAIGPIALTRAMCSEASQSNEFVAQLETTTSYKVSGGQLTLTTSSGDMTFTPQAAGSTMS